jgi:hypothetical protein
VSDHRVGSSTAQVPTSLPPLRSPLASMHAAFGSDVTIEGGAEIVRSYGDPERERAALFDTIGLADVTVMSKIDVRGDVDPALTSALGLNHSGVEHVVGEFGGGDLDQGDILLHLLLHLLRLAHHLLHVTGHLHLGLLQISNFANFAAEDFAKALHFGIRKRAGRDFVFVRGRFCQ